MKKWTSEVDIGWDFFPRFWLTIGCISQGFDKTEGKMNFTVALAFLMVLTKMVQDDRSEHQIAYVPQKLYYKMDLYVYSSTVRPWPNLYHFEY